MRVASAGALLCARIEPTRIRWMARPTHDAHVQDLTAEIAHIASGVTRETDVLFAVSMEIDEDRARQHAFSLARW